jgi:D-threo-aldose 1-dehydrogenase
MMKISDVRKLPHAGLALGVFGLGGAPLGGLYQAVSDADAARVLEGAWDAGLRYFDTAPYYGYTLSERRLGALLVKRPRDSFVVSTKVGRLMRADATVQAGDDDWAQPLPFRPIYDYSYDGVLRSFEDSLQRLGLARIDILYVHDIGRTTHGDRHQHYWQQLTRGGGFRALESLRAQGQIAAIGLGVNEWQVVYDSMQEVRLDCTLLAGRYTLLEQTSLTPLLTRCESEGNAIVIGGPFNSGVLAGNNKFNYADAPPEIVERVAALKSICASFDVPLQAAALQFPMAHPAVVSCIPGAHTLTQLQQNMAWFEQAIPLEFWQALREAGLIDPRAPVPVGGA